MNRLGQDGINWYDWGCLERKARALGEKALSLTDNEGTFLALVLRIQPTTVYEVAKIYEASPVSNFNTSKGKLYPLVRRLRELKLLDAVKVVADKRGTEKIKCTPAGEAALRNWIKQIRPSHLLLEDPLRTKLQSFDLLTKPEKIEWIGSLRGELLKKLAALENYKAEVSVPYHELVHENAVNAITHRLEWLDRVLQVVMEDTPPQHA